MKLYIHELEKFLELEVDNDVKKIINIFLSAVNDWPNSILTLEDYELEVEKFVNGVTKKNTIKKCLKNGDVSKNSWKLESLSQVFEVFQFYKNDDPSLKEIIDDLKNKLGKQSKNSTSK